MNATRHSSSRVHRSVGGLLGWCRGFVVVAWALQAASALAAEGHLRFGESEPDLSCLTRADASPMAYPAQAAKTKSEAVLRLRLTFSGPDAAPGIAVLGNSGGSEFEDAARAYAGRYRLPCMKATQPVVVTQDYTFRLHARPDDIGPLKTQGDELQRCAVVDGQAFPWPRGPVYSRRAMEGGESGVVLAQMRFTSAAEPPEVKIVFDGGNRHLSASTARFLADVRLTCLAAGETVTAMMPFRFAIEGESRTVFRDITLTQFVSLLQPKVLERPSNRVRFDLSAMGCPFDLQFELFQPYKQNSVSVSKYDARREPLLAWMRQLDLDLPTPALKRVLANPMTISVPCGALDLT